MRTAAHAADSPQPAALDLDDLAQPAGQAFRLLHAGFTVAPILFGLDKFANLLTDWTQYLAPIFPNLLGLSNRTFMYGVGVVEIAAGVLVALKPRYAAYVVAGWLAGIILNLLILGQYLDVALRDFGLLLAALALARLAEARARRVQRPAQPGASAASAASAAPVRPAA
ncbi:MAG: hypothetical protein ACRDJN_11675 [Chloroflexota bacterium]